jgi:hypothetical protein
MGEAFIKGGHLIGILRYVTTFIVTTENYIISIS